MSSFEGKNMQSEYKVLTYRTDLYFHGYKLIIESGQSDRNIDYK